MPVRGKQEVVFESGLIRALAGKTGKELPSHFSIGIDREQIPEATLYGGRRIWRYSNEQVWKWIPVYELPLTDGEHLLQITALSSHLRFEQIYITKGEELPPVHESV